jgi:beta-mannosidase
MRFNRAWRLFVTAVFLLSLNFTLSPPLRAAVNQNVELNSGWEFNQLTDAKGVAIPERWRAAVVPGDVHLDLLRYKLIPPPFYRDNEAKLQWIENADWEYRKAVQISPAVFSRQNIDLVFDGLDTCARVYLNGKLMLTSDNMFRTYRVSAKSALNSGANQLLVVFPSPIRCAAKIAAKDLWRPDTHTSEKSYIRKAAYEYGWDWAPRFVTSGMWRPVHLEAWDATRISDLNVRQLDVTQGVAHIVAEVEVTADKEAAAVVDANYQINGKVVHAAEDTNLHRGVNHIEIPFMISRPELWYPAGYGSQPMYAFHTVVKIGGIAQDTWDVRTGLRSAVLRRDPDQWGRSFEFVVNGIPIFAKGTNVIPFDNFPNRVSVEQIRYILQSAKDSNMNMVRVWGGGYYETKEFYEICDELGIMVWQDFMFGNPWQPGTYSFKQNVAAEVKDQLIRLRNHPSIVLWCGNNEQESNFTQDTKTVTPYAKVQMWEDYLTLFSGIIPTEVARYAPATAYWPSTPSTDYEETKAKNYRVLEDGDDAAGNYESGDAHDYSVWDSAATLPKVPFSAEEDRYYRFVSEYGFQSFPDMRTVDAFTLPEDRVSLGTPVMMAHQKAVAGPGTVDGYPTIHAYMLQYYGEPKDLPSLVYASQIVQAEGIKTIAEHLRRDRPRTMGSLYWQLNDCWPGVTSSSIDYYGRWKALQYYARRFYAPLLVSARVKDGTLFVHTVSDKTGPVSAKLRVRVMRFDGVVVTEKTETVVLPPLSAKTIMQLPVADITKGGDLGDLVAAMDLSVGGKQVSSNLIYFVSTKQVHLPAARIATKLAGTNGTYTLQLSSPVLARSVFVSFGDHDATLSDNYFDILPGEPVIIYLNSRASLDELLRNLKVMSLADAFVSDPSQKGFAWE